LLIEEWENINTGAIVYAERYDFGSNAGYRVYADKNADYLWYDK